MPSQKENIARFVVKIAEQVTGERFVFELLDGPVTGDRLEGCVGWRHEILPGKACFSKGHWRVMLNSSPGDCRFYHNALHELAHVALGHQKRTVDTTYNRVDKALIANGPVDSLGAARLGAYVKQDAAKEAAAEAWALDVARDTLDNLNRYLEICER